MYFTAPEIVTEMMKLVQKSDLGTTSAAQDWTEFGIEGGMTFTLDNGQQFEVYVTQTDGPRTGV